MKIWSLQPSFPETNLTTSTGDDIRVKNSLYYVLPIVRHKENRDEGIGITCSSESWHIYVPARQAQNESPRLELGNKEREAGMS